MSRLELSIDELVLVGIAPAEGHRLADEIERELALVAVDVHPSWVHGSPPVAIRADGVNGRGNGGSVGRQVADQISTVLATGQAS